MRIDGEASQGYFYLARRRCRLAEQVAHSAELAVLVENSIRRTEVEIGIVNDARSETL